MDKTTNGEKEVKAKKYVGFEFDLPSPKNEEISKFWKETDEHCRNVLRAVEKDSKSFLSSKKAFYYIHGLAYATYEAVKWQYVLAYAVQDAEERLATLEKIVEEITRKLNIDLPNVKTEMDQLKATINSPAITVVSEFVEQMNKNISEYKKKMEENDLAE